MTSPNRRKVLAIGHCAPGTGFSRVMREILAGLSECWDCHWIGIGYKGVPRVEPSYTLYPCNLQGGDVFGAYQARRRIAELRPSLVFLLNDFRNLGRFGRVLGEAPNKVPTLADTPVDGEITDYGLIERLGYLDRLVLYSEFGRFQLQRATRQLQAVRLGFQFPPMEIVSHRDTGAFSPRLTPSRNPARLMQGLKPSVGCFPTSPRYGAGIPSSCSMPTDPLSASESI